MGHVQRADAHWARAIRIDELRAKLDLGAATPAEVAEFVGGATLVSVKNAHGEIGDFGVDVWVDLDQEALRGVLSCLSTQNARMRSIVKDLLDGFAQQQKEIDELRGSMQNQPIPTPTARSWED